MNKGICCSNLKDGKALMKMGLALVLVGHVNFLLGALVHGAVLRLILEKAKIQTLVSTIANVIAIVAGLMGIISGITAIVLSKNKKNKILMWVLLVFSFLAGLLGIASAVGLSVSVVKVFMYKGMKILQSHCKTNNETVVSSVTFECPFDPTRIYPTIVILWIPLVFMSIVESVFTFRCFAVCTSFLYLCPCRKKPVSAKRVRIQRKTVSLAPILPENPDPEAEVEPAEHDDLLNGSTEVEHNEWV